LNVVYRPGNCCGENVNRCVVGFPGRRSRRHVAFGLLAATAFFGGCESPAPVVDDLGPSPWDAFVLSYLNGS
jgi:hypothetical protein